MRRIAPYERVAEYRERTTGPAGRELRERLAAWAASVADTIGVEWPEMPDGVRDRAADVWEPLFVVAELAGGDWPRRVRDACAVLMGAATENTASVAVRLLHDLYQVFRDGDDVAPARSTETILDKLHAMDEAPWGDWYGRRFAPRDLAKTLKPFGVKSTTVRIGEIVAKGYRSDDLRESWVRYGVLTDPTVTPVTSVTPLISTVTDVTGVSDTRPTDDGEPLVLDFQGDVVTREDEAEATEQACRHIIGLRYCERCGAPGWRFFGHTLCATHRDDFILDEPDDFDDSAECDESKYPAPDPTPPDPDQDLDAEFDREEPRPTSTSPSTALSRGPSGNATTRTGTPASRGHSSARSADRPEHNRDPYPATRTLREENE
jgi:hypothetical protein